jgi:hypothetical protein
VAPRRDDRTDHTLTKCRRPGPAVSATYRTVVRSFLRFAPCESERLAYSGANPGVSAQSMTTVLSGCQREKHCSTPRRPKLPKMAGPPLIDTATTHRGRSHGVTAMNTPSLVAPSRSPVACFRSRISFLESSVHRLRSSGTTVHPRNLSIVADTSGLTICGCVVSPMLRSAIASDALGP